MHIESWKSGTHYKTPAHVAAQEMQKLHETVGLTPHNLVEASRDETAPLHNEFEWNDSTAAEKYRETQAAQMIRSITFTETEQESIPEPIRMYFPTGEKTYEPIQIIMSDKNKQQALLEHALRELIWFKKKYKMLNQLSGIMAEIDILTKEVGA